MKMNEPEDEDSMHESAKYNQVPLDSAQNIQQQREEIDRMHEFIKQPKAKKSTGAEQLTWAALEQNEPYDNDWLARSIKENVEVWKKEVTEQVMDDFEQVEKQLQE